MRMGRFRRAMTASAFAFAEPPPVGVAISIAGQRYDLTDIEPYTKADGGETELAVWSAACSCCGCEFTHRMSRLRFPELRNCEPCRVAARNARPSLADKLTESGL